jgi:hypothetical protein
MNGGRWPLNNLAGFGRIWSNLVGRADGKLGIFAARGHKDRKGESSEFIGVRELLSFSQF